MLSIDQNLSSRLDGWADGYPGRQFWAIVFAKYCVWAYLGTAMIAYRWVNGQADGYGLYLFLLFASVGVVHLFVVILSFLIGRKRPYERLPDAWHLPIKLYTPSFPSGHATIAFAITFFLIWIWQPAWPIALGLVGLASLIALARVLVGVHYLTDILAGALIGSIGVIGVLQILEIILLFGWR